MNNEMMSVIALRRTAIDDLLMVASPNSGQLEITMEMLKSSDADQLVAAYAKVLQEPAE